MRLYDDQRTPRRLGGLRDSVTTGRRDCWIDWRALSQARILAFYRGNHIRESSRSSPKLSEVVKVTYSNFKKLPSTPSNNFT